METRGSLKRNSRQLRSGRVIQSPSNDSKLLSGSKRKAGATKSEPSLVDVVPSHLIYELILTKLGSRDLLAIGSTCLELRAEACDNLLWESLFYKEFGPRTKLLERAANIAGGYRHLYREKVLSSRLTGPSLHRATRSEVQGLIALMGDNAHPPGFQLRPQGQAQPQNMAQAAAELGPELEGQEGLSLEGGSGAGSGAAGGALSALAAAAADGVAVSDLGPGGSGAVSAGSPPSGPYTRETTPPLEELSLAMGGGSGAQTPGGSPGPAARMGTEAPATPVAPLPPSATAAAIFLVDGSGSVSDEEFTEMIQFAEEAACSLVGRYPGAHVALIQFSNEATVEVPLAAHSEDNIRTAFRAVQRSNGGTNIHLALFRTGALISAAGLPPRSTKAVVMLTDGRIDTVQALEAERTASKLCDDLGPVHLYAVGVGRGVEKEAMMQILEAKGCGSPITAPLASNSRYLELHCRESPW